MDASVNRRVFVVGNGMTKFVKPGTSEDYPDMVKEAATKALQDARIEYSDVQAASVGYVYGESTSGQRAVYELGMTGIPVYNVNNNCATGSTALLLAKQLILTGEYDCVLAVGFEKMQKGSLTSQFPDYTPPLDRHVNVMTDTYGFEPAPITAQIFGNAGREYMKKYGAKKETFAKIALKNHKHSVNNPYSQFRDEYTLDQILNSTMIFDPLTKLQCCPTSNGSAAAIIASEQFVKRFKLENQAVEIVAMEMATDLENTLTEKSAIKLAGYDVTKLAARKAFKKAGVNVTDVDVVELHDCFSTNELISYEALGLCPEGKAEELINAGDTTYGGKYVINPSGGLISKGHPLGATGLAQCAELCWQLRKMAEQRQVPNAKLALQHNIGLGGAAVVGIYRLYATNNTSLSDVISEEEKSFKTIESFNRLKETLKRTGSELVKKIRSVYVIEVNKGPLKMRWTVDLKNGIGSLTRGPSEIKPNCTVAISDDDLYDLIAGKLNSQKAFMQGKLKIKGNTLLALKLQDILGSSQSKL